MRVDGFATPSLGDTSYIVSTGHTAIVIDPQRDLRRFLDHIEENALEVSHVLDTHVHNDYLSGAKPLAERLGAEVVMPAGSGAEFRFRPAFHQEGIDTDGGLSILPLHTPGHTLEHTSYLVSLDTGAAAVFTGGSLLVGSAGRCDLLGPDLATQLTRLQWGSLQRLAALPGRVAVHPTHGAGSFCTASGGARGSSTIEVEARTNPVFSYPDEEAFVAGQLAGLLPYPDYYAHMAPHNRRGPHGLEPATPATLEPPEVTSAIEDGAAVVDARDRYAFARGHIPGSLNVELSDSFAPWVGWMVEFGSPVIVVASDIDAAEQARVELGRIGYDVIGAITSLEGLEQVTSKTAGPVELAAAVDGAAVIDVRDPAERSASPVRGTIHRYVPDLRDGLPTSDDEVWLTCASGFRAAVAAGLVERHGATPIVVASGGIPELLRLRPDLAG